MFAPGPLRNAALGYLAVLRGDPTEAGRLLQAAWERSDSTGDASLRAVVAQRLAHGLGAGGRCPCRVLGRRI